MSAEHFQTFLTCDVRTAPNGRDVEYVERQTGWPRGMGRTPDGEYTFSECYLYAENVLKIAADTIASDMMSGITGDHPEKREHLADIVRAVAKATRLLALDDAYDATLDDKRWAEALIEIHNTIDKTRELA